jgi:hypothetical protein
METMETKTCRCCETDYTPAAWRALAYVGLLDDGTDVLEFRNCPCGGTMTVVLCPSDPHPTPREGRAHVAH